jgi:hypothetical protein
MPVISMGLPSGSVPKAPLFVPVIVNVAATRDPSRFSKESTISESKFPMAALKVLGPLLECLATFDPAAPGNDDEVLDDEVVDGVEVLGRPPHLLPEVVNRVDA